MWLTLLLDLEVCEFLDCVCVFVCVHVCVCGGVGGGEGVMATSRKREAERAHGSTLTLMCPGKSCVEQTCSV